VKQKRRISAILLTTIILLNIFLSQGISISRAATILSLPVTINYNPATLKWDFSWTQVAGSDQIEVTYRKPDGSLVSTTEPAVAVAGKNTVSLSLESDFIYQVNITVRNAGGDVIGQRERFFLADMTFFGDSFDESAAAGYGIKDNKPKFIDKTDTELDAATTQDILDGVSNPGTVTKIVSGENPKIRFRWKVPRIFDLASGTVIPVTDRTDGVDAGTVPDILEYLHSTTPADIPINGVKFQVRMRGATGINSNTYDEFDFNIYYNSTNSKWEVLGRNIDVSGINSAGLVTSADGFAEFVIEGGVNGGLHGIKPGCEYENVRIKTLFYYNNTVNEVGSKMVAGYKSDTPIPGDTIEGFDVQNNDSCFIDPITTLSTLETPSIYTPMRFEMTKVDIDKILLKVWKINSTNRSDMYYQMQDAGSLELLTGTGSTLADTGPKLPDTSIDSDPGYGEVIVEIPLNSDGSNPQRYYRVIVTDNDARTPLGSMAVYLGWLGKDTGKPPMPANIEVKPLYAGVETIDVKTTSATQESIELPTSNITISFDKPYDYKNKLWKDVVGDGSLSAGDYIYHVVINGYVSDDIRKSEERKINGTDTVVYFPTKSKRVFSFSKNYLKEVAKNPDRLEIDFSKFDSNNQEGIILFNEFIQTTANGGRNSIPEENNEDINEDGIKQDYPSVLLPNTPYYIQVFTTRYEDLNRVKWYEGYKSFIDVASYLTPLRSFTTFPSDEMPVPVPKFTLTNEIKPNSVTGDTEFTGVNIDITKILTEKDWESYTDVSKGREIYYDIYMNNSPDFGDPVGSPAYTYIHNYPDNLIANPIALNTKRDMNLDLKENSIYYFMVKARVAVDNDGNDADTLENGVVISSSDFSAIQSITTPKVNNGEIDDLERRPRAPVEFKISQDTEGNKLITGTEVLLEWINFETDVEYELICTTVRINENALLNSYQNDNYNIRFQQVYQSYKTIANDPELGINPINTPLNAKGFTYDTESTRICKLPINLDFMDPNHLYFYSLRAVRNRGAADEQVSLWVSIPVTTKLVDAPESVEAMKDIELGFDWTDTTLDLSSEDLAIWLKKANASVYEEVSRANYTIVKDGSKYYGRLYNLISDTTYNIKVYNKKDKVWVTDSSFPKTMKTRDAFHEIEISWIGKPTNQYHIEMKTSTDRKYTPLEYKSTGDSDYWYETSNGTRYEFYKELTNRLIEDNQVNGSDKWKYYARIRKMEVKKPNGTISRQSLKSNTTYYCKVWAENIEESLHIGPVTSRTDFNQQDYDDEGRRDDIEFIYKEAIAKLEERLYWEIDKKNTQANRILLKSDRVSELIQYSGKDGFSLDLRGLKEASNTDEILIPIEVFDSLKKHKKSITIMVNGASYTFGPTTLDLASLRRLASNPANKQLIVKLVIVRQGSNIQGLPPDAQAVSNVNKLQIQVMGSSKTYANLKGELYGDLFGATNINSSEKALQNSLYYSILNELLSDSTLLTYKSQTYIEGIVSEAIKSIEEQISVTLGDVIYGRNGYRSIINEQKEINSFASYLRVSLVYSMGKGIETPFVKYTGETAFSKLQTASVQVMNSAIFTVIKPGEYAILLVPQQIIANEDTYPYSNSIKDFINRYDISDIFDSGGVFYPENKVVSKQAVLLFELVSENQGRLKGYSIKDKANKMGIGGLVNTRNQYADVTKQETAALVVEIFCAKTGSSSDYLEPTGTIFISNEGEIEDKYYKYIEIVIDMGIMSLDSAGKFDFNSSVTQGEIIEAFSKVLKRLGEL